MYVYILHDEIKYFYSIFVFKKKKIMISKLRLFMCVLLSIVMGIALGYVIFDKERLGQHPDCPSPNKSSLKIETIMEQGFEIHTQTSSLIWQNDDNVVFYKNDTQILWATSSNNLKPKTGKLKADGKLYLFDASGNVVFANYILNKAPCEPNITGIFIDQCGDIEYQYPDA